MAPLVRTGGSRHTGLAAPPHRNIQKDNVIAEKDNALAEQARLIEQLKKQLAETRSTD